MEQRRRSPAAGEAGTNAERGRPVIGSRALLCVEIRREMGKVANRWEKNQSCLLYHGGWLAPDLAANILAADFRAAVSPASWRKRYAGAPKSTMASQKWYQTKR